MRSCPVVQTLNVLAQCLQISRTFPGAGTKYNDVEFLWGPGSLRENASPYSSVNWDQLFLSPFVGEWNRFISFPRWIWDIQFLSICERTYCQRSYPNSNAVAHALFFMDIGDLLLAYRPKNNRPRCIFNFCGRICLGVCQIPIKIEKIIINSQLSRAKKTPDPAEICP